MKDDILNARTVDNAGVDVGYRQAGSGPLVIFCHGFPGLSYSWRHQLQALAAAGFRAVAVDMRGYGGSGKPIDVAAYSLDHIRSDMMSLLDALGEERAIFVGHDFGTPVVWNLALECPQRVAGLVAMSVPYDFDYYGRRGMGHADAAPPEILPSQQFAAYAENAFLHAHYFQQPGPADQELDDNPAAFLRRIFWTLSAEGDLLTAFSGAKPDMGYLEVLTEPDQPLPWDWLDEAAFNHYVAVFKAGGFSGPLNWYRVADINWQLNRRYLGQKIHTPTLFIAGQQDPVMVMSGPESLDFMREMVPGLLGIVQITGAGHWVQQEKADLVSQYIIDFARSIYAEPSYC